MDKTRVYTGCSGFFYKGWKGKFYPEEIPQKQWLEFYSEKFDTVEINNSFYRLPKEVTFKSWYACTPDNFRFSVKGSRYITHFKRLKDPAPHVTKLYNAITPLDNKLSCVLWQLPGSFKRNTKRLDIFCKSLSTEFMNVLEIRDESWHHEKVYEILEKHKVSLCITSSPVDTIDRLVKTTQSAYIRFHGKKSWYDYSYDQKELELWVQNIKKLAVRDAFIYFNNDHHAYAVENGQAFKLIADKEFG